MDSNSSEIRQSWFAVHVRSNFERIVHRNLEVKGYEVFLPTYRVQRRWSDRLKEIDVPLFSGYVFCRFDPKNRLPVLNTPGVVQIVGQGSLPASIDDEEITAVKSIVSSRLPYLPWPSLILGQHVVADKGPLVGVQGVLIEMKGPRRLVVSITILQRSVAVEVDSSWVQPMDPLTTRLPQARKVAVV